MDEMTNIAYRRDLATQAVNGTYTDDDRQALMLSWGSLQVEAI
ncbi:hypothetical protein OK016_27425 [Vibrio chagasii]|nr:hypothetical protein [Vibrio chagasii]